MSLAASNLKGIIPPLVTPLTEDESLDHGALERLVEHVIAGGVSGLFVLGSCGEGSTVSDAVKEEMVRATSALARGKVPVLVGVLAVSTRQAIDLARRLTRQGGDAIVVVSPFYFSHSQEEIAAHMTAVAKSVDVPTLVYNIPQMVKVILEPRTVAGLAAVPEIIGIKDSQGDMTQFQQYVAVQESRDDFAVFQGAEAVAAMSFARGARGGVLGISNVAPQLCCDMYAAASSGDLARAWEIQERLVALSSIYSRGHWLACIKAAMNLLGICGPTAGAPFASLPESAVAAIRADLQAAELL